tara:strand:- start:153 stop:440 length:288 start_codon:yes stop_codon:yes gene_type:complete
MINDLIKIADELDKKGLRKEADFMDNILKKYAAYPGQPGEDPIIKCRFDLQACRQASGVHRANAENVMAALNRANERLLAAGLGAEHAFLMEPPI